MRRLALLSAIIALQLTVWAQTGVVSGRIVKASGSGVAGATISFNLSQVGYVAGSYVTTPLTYSCYTTSDGSIVGEPDPAVAPTVSLNYSSGTMAAGTYYVRYSFQDSSGESLASPSLAVVMTSAGTMTINIPATVPSSAVFMKVYIGTAAGAEKYQGFGTLATATPYAQSTAINTGSAAVPVANTSACTLIYNDAIIPARTVYAMAVVDANGSSVPGFPQSYYIAGTSPFVISSSTPAGNTTAIFPQAIIASPTNHATQSVAGPLLSSNLGGTRYADQFTGATTGDKIDAACNDLGGAIGVVDIQGNAAAGIIKTVPPFNCFLQDFRNTGDTASAGNYQQGVELYRRETRDRSAATYLSSLITLRYEDYSGGVNLASPKTQSQIFAGFYDGRDPGEHHGFANIKQFCQAYGDCISLMFYIYGFGGYGAGGDEGQEGLRIWNNVGDGTATGGVSTSSSITVNGLTISGTWVNPHNLGVRNAPLIITSRGTYSTGTLSGATSFSGGACHITGVGTNWKTQFGSGAKSTLFLRIPQLESASSKFIVPITAVDNTVETDISINYQTNEIGAGCPTLVAGTYTIYQGSTVTSLGPPVSGTIDPNYVIVASASPFLNGDAVEQPVDYNVTMFGFSVTQYSPFTQGGLHRGGYIQNIGPAQLESGLRINGNTGGYQYGIRMMNTIGYAIKGGEVMNGFLTSSDTTTANFFILSLLSSGSSARSFTYNRTSDYFNMAGMYWDGATTRISTNSTPQPNVQFYLGYTGAAMNGLLIAPGTAPNAGVFQFAVYDNGGITRLSMDIGNNRYRFNNGTDVQGYSDNGVTQKWSIAGASGNIATVGSVQIGSGAAITKHLSAAIANAAWDLSAAGITCAVQTVTVNGAVTNSTDSVDFNVDSTVMATTDIQATAWISAADTVSVRLCDVQSSNPAAFTNKNLRVSVWKH